MPFVGHEFNGLSAALALAWNRGYCFKTARCRVRI